MKVNPIADIAYHSRHEIDVFEGGTYSGKTFGILAAIIRHMTTAGKGPYVGTVVGQDIPALKKGAYRDCQHLIYDDPGLTASVANHHKGDRLFEFYTGSVLEFSSFDDAEDAKHGKRDFLFPNEANMIPGDVFHVLHDRTRIKTYIDFNPSFLFWAHDELKQRDDVLWHHSTYKDNAFLDEGIRRKIEAYEPTPENIERGTANEWYWKVYGLGVYAPREGAVFEEWDTCSEEEIPAPGACKLHGFGLDFGFSNSPAAVVECSLTSGGTLYLREHLYETGLTNADLSNELDRMPIGSADIIADSAEPKSIKELNDYGHNVEGSEKGADSVEHGIQLMKQFKIRIASTSKNCRREFEAYRWKEDRGGNRLNKPVKKNDHFIDGARGFLQTKLGAPEGVVKATYASA